MARDVQSRREGVVSVAALCSMLATASIMPQSQAELWAMSAWDVTAFASSFVTSILLVAEVVREHGGESGNE